MEPKTKEIWIDRCFRQYLIRGITNEEKAKLWAESSWYRVGESLDIAPEDTANDDLDSW